MTWLCLVVWIIPGLLNFLNRESTNLRYWKIMYWLTYGSLMLLIIANCIDLVVRS